MSIMLLEPILAILIGIAILIRPALLSYLVAGYLILTGLLRLIALLG